MSSSISAIERSLRRLVRCKRGATAAEFGLVLPMMVVLSLGILEFTLVMLHIHQANEATRRAARVVVTSPPIADLANLPTANVLCGGASSGVTCTGGGVTASTTFNSALAQAQLVLPTANAENLQVMYRSSGIGDITTPGGLLSQVTVSLVGVQHQFVVLQALVPGLGPTIQLPAFATSLIGPGATAP